jgi:RNA polymerase sigma-70 factor (ECF subfamily)
VSSSPETELTVLLKRMGGGDKTARDELFRLVHGDLHAQARWLMRAQPTGHTLQATALVNEAYLRLAGDRTVDWEDRRHFFGVAARAMRSVLVDHARAKARAKRTPPDLAETRLDELCRDHEDRVVDMLELDRSLTELAGQDEQAAQVVELRFFGGLTVEETAKVLDCSGRTVEREWRFARSWLRERLA